MNRNKGFTLIELLAVIVILAIIALIATPIVLGIIDDTKESANKQSATFIVNAVEQSYSMAYAINGGEIPTIVEVKERFSMDNAKWETVNGKEVIRTLDGNVTCDVINSGNEFSIKCSNFGAESKTMEVSF